MQHKLWLLFNMAGLARQLLQLERGPEPLCVLHSVQSDGEFIGSLFRTVIIVHLSIWDIHLGFSYHIILLTYYFEYYFISIVMCNNNVPIDLFTCHSVSASVNICILCTAFLKA